MTTIITRLYPDTATAQSVIGALLAEGHVEDYIDVIGKDGESDIASRLRNARVGAAGRDALPGVMPWWWCAPRSTHWVRREMP
jgi:hypothetical protein